MNDTRIPALRRRVILTDGLPVAAYALCAIAFVLLTLTTYQGTALPGDIFIARYLQSINFPVFDALMQALTRMGFWVPSSIILGLFALAFGIARKPVEVLFIFLTATGDLMNQIIKVVVARPRPLADVVIVFEELNEYSFPSAHVTHYVVFYGFLFFLFWTLLPGSWPRTFALVVTASLILLSGPSRIYLGAHWPSDVLGAYLLGGLWLVMLIETYTTCKQRWELRRLRERRDTGE